MAKRTMRKSRKNKRKSRKNNRRRTLKGGQCYGRGIGANSNDPNYSIFNTNALKQFPYKPT
jgi:hypothetical protein